MTQEMRIGMVGAGMISAFHLTAWSRVPELRVVAIADPDLCQKPLAPTLAEAEKLVADTHGRIRLMVHENWRFRPNYRQIATWLAESRVGRVTSASISVRSSGLIPDTDGRRPALMRQPFFAHERRLLVAESLIHQIDVARWLLGPLRHVASRMTRTSDAVVGETVAAVFLTWRRCGWSRPPTRAPAGPELPDQAARALEPDSSTRFSTGSPRQKRPRFAKIAPIFSR